MKRWYERRCKPLSTLKGQNIYLQKKPNDPCRQERIIVERVKDRSYTLQSNDGVLYYQNRVHIPPTQVEVKILNNSPVMSGKSQSVMSDEISRSLRTCLFERL